MKTLLIVVATTFVTILMACGSDEEEYMPTSTPAASSSELVTTTVEPTPETTQTPEPTPDPDHDFGEPTQQDVSAANEIFEAIQSLPETESYRITYDPLYSGSPGGVFQVVILKAAGNAEYSSVVQEAQNWFRDQGFEPCERPLDRTILYMFENAPGPGYTYEPCSDYNN